MTFQSLSFLAFLAVTVAACLTVGRRAPWRGRLLLTLACLVFYIMGGVGGFLVLAAGTAVTAAVLQRLCGKEDGSRRRALALGCCWHIAVLAAFKYAGFFTGGRVTVGWAPLGLSFFTFQQLWLLKEVYTRQYRPAQGDSLILYAFFFPTVTSGPILRPGAFFPQLREGRFLRPGWRDVSAGLYAICCGMVKKVLLADPLGVVAGNGWADPAALSAPAAWLVMLAYTLQLYLDFSGYCDIASGAARLLGLRLPVNFDSPYRALSVGEFWKRWHMTLTAFLRECLYIPLGGSKQGTARTYLNILTVFLVSGFWHGAGWTFLVWGALHALAQIVERAWGPGRERLPKALRWALTFLFVNAAWVFFRAPSLSAAGQLLTAAVSGGWELPGDWLLAGFLTSEREALMIAAPALAQKLSWLALAGLYGAAALASVLPGNTIRRMDTFRPAFWRGLVLAGLTAWCILSFSGITTFIYSNF